MVTKAPTRRSRVSDRSPPDLVAVSIRTPTNALSQWSPVHSRSSQTRTRNLATTSSAATLIVDSSLDLVLQVVDPHSVDLEAAAADSQVEEDGLVSTRRSHQRNYSTDSSMEDLAAWAVVGSVLSVRQTKKKKERKTGVLQPKVQNPN